MPKIFLFVNSGKGTDWQIGCALSEDGEFLAAHCSSSEGFGLRQVAHVARSARVSAELASEIARFGELKFPGGPVRIPPPTRSALLLSAKQWATAGRERAQEAAEVAAGEDYDYIVNCIDRAIRALTEMELAEDAAADSILILVAKIANEALEQCLTEVDE
jgi:hypothetical protein